MPLAGKFNRLLPNVVEDAASLVFNAITGVVPMTEGWRGAGQEVCTREWDLTVITAPSPMCAVCLQLQLRLGVLSLSEHMNLNAGKSKPGFAGWAKYTLLPYPHRCDRC